MRVELNVFSYRSLATTSLLAQQAMLRETIQAGVPVDVRMYGNALIHHARNTAIAGMKPGSTHVLFMDDDMVPTPDSLLKMLDLDKPVVSALCTTRTLPVAIAAKLYDPGKDVFGAIDRVKLDRVLEGNFAPGGAFLLLRRDVVESLIEYHLSARDWLEENRRMLDRLHVRLTQRETERARKESIRRSEYAAAGRVRVFDYPVSDTEQQLGEDITLGRKLYQLGIPVCLDTRVIVGHLGEYPFSVHDLEGQSAHN